MNREILFKGKRTDNGEWVEGYIVAYPSGKCGIYKKATEPPDILLFCEVDPSTICWYIGLHDGTKWEQLSAIEQEKFLSEWNVKENRKNKKEDWNGKKIWENDICIIHSGFIDEEDGYFTVEWDDDGSRFVLYEDGLTVDFDNYHGHECEVIGNVFDNPELLEGGGSDA